MDGISANTMQRILMGPGAVYIGSAGTQLLGATKGGNVFELTRAMLDIRPDGAKGKVKGGRFVESVEAVLTVRLMEVTEQNVVYAIAGSSLASHVITGGEIAAATYIDKVTIKAEIKGTTTTTEAKEVDIALTNCLVEGPFTVNLPEQGDAGAIEMKFTAHFDPSAMTTEPWSVTFVPVT